MVDVATDGHLQTACQCLEDSLNLMVLVLPFGTNEEVHACGIAEALEEVEEHLGGHVAHIFALEGGVPHQPGTTAEV